MNNSQQQTINILQANKNNNYDKNMFPDREV